MNKLVLINGKIYVERDVFAQAVYAEDGVIKLVGNNDQVLAAAGEGTQVIDCEGKTVIPGLNDSHQHLLMIGIGMAQADILHAAGLMFWESRLVQNARNFPPSKNFMLALNKIIETDAGFKSGASLDPKTALKGIVLTLLK